MIALLRALALTVVVEGVLMLALSRRPIFVYYSFLGNLLTNPALNLLLIGAALVWLPEQKPLFLAALAALECAAAAVEALLYRRLCDYSAARAVLVSVLLNAASFSVGWALSPPV
ncbi:MAG: hypothetical protein VB092_00630 [Oscillospiraceae bacterium]|nr:hypothetical protein [Oscillospiraceae bacterium]